MTEEKAQLKSYKEWKQQFGVSFKEGEFRYHKGSRVYLDKDLKLHYSSYILDHERGKLRND